MVLIKSRFLALCCILLFAAPLFPQNNSAQFSVEIASIEKKLSDSKLPAAERKAALETMARLFELSGNFERAAEAWKEKALAVNTDYQAMLQSARCLAAIGEFDKADAALRPVLAITGDRTLQNNARLLSAQVEGLKTGNTAMLANLLANPDFAGQKAAVYYSIWRISANPTEQSLTASRLLAEFPQSPEARIIRDDNAVSASPAALWFLAGISGTTNASQPITMPESQSGGPALLQTGLFSLEENAKNMAAKLQNAGFSAVITKKTVNGKEHWTVGVAPGPDPSRTMQLLKDKGFESFPIY